MHQWQDKYSIRLNEPLVGSRELSMVEEALAGGWIFGAGPHIDRLETVFKERIGMDALVVSCGTAAIHLALAVLGVQDGDEVVVPTQTFAATCNPIIYLGAKPVFVDSSEETWTIDPNHLSELLEMKAKRNRLPRAVITVDLFGNAADMDEIRTICNLYGVPILEDAAHAFGGEYNGIPTGALGDLGVFSMNGNKIISAGGGGVLLTKNSAFMERARKLANQGRGLSPDGFSDYYYNEIGYNYRLSNILAALGLAQIESVDERLERKREIADRYFRELCRIPGISSMPTTPGAHHTYWLSAVLFDQDIYGTRVKDILNRLLRDKIESTPIWKPLHTQPPYSHFETKGGEVAESLNRSGICLPSSLSLSLVDQDQVIDLIRRTATKVESV